MAQLKEVNPSAALPQTSTSAEKKKTRVTPNKPIPTDRITFQKQLDLLRAYAAAAGPTAKPVLAKDVAKIVNMADTTVATGTPFLVALGFLQKTGEGFIPSADAQNYNRAYGWNKETAAMKLAPAISGAWFAQTLMPRLAFSELSEQQAIDALAEASAASPEYETQLRLTIDYMEAAGLVSREGGIIRAKTTTPAPEPEAKMAQPSEGPANVSREVSRSAISTMFSQAAEGAVNFHVTVKVDMAEFAAWTPDRIAAFFAGIAQVLAAKAGLEKEITQ